MHITLMWICCEACSSSSRATGLLMMSCSITALLPCCCSLIELQESHKIINWGHSSHADFMQYCYCLCWQDEYIPWTCKLIRLSTYRSPWAWCLSRRSLKLVQSCHTVSSLTQASLAWRCYVAYAALICTKRLTSLSALHPIPFVSFQSFST